MDSVVVAGVLTAAAGLLALGARSARARPSPSGRGTARWSTPREIQRSGVWRQDGPIVGYAHRRHLRLPRQKHLLMVGPAGSGKSIMMRKTLETYRGSVICLDLKGTLTEETAAIRAGMGQSVEVFDPVHGGAHLNPCDWIGWGTGTEVADIQRVVEHLTYTEANTRSDAGLYYLSEAQEALWALIPYLHYSRIEEPSLGGLRRFLSVSGTEIRGRIRDMLAFGQPTPHPVMDGWAKQVVAKSLDLLDKIWSAARRWLMAWVDPVLSWHTHETTIDWRTFQQSDTPATLYLRVSVEDLQGRLRAFTRLLLDLLSMRLCDRPEQAYRHDVLWVLDDMAELRYLPMIERLTAYLRGYGHLLLGGTQSFAQLWQWFGRFSGVLNNTAAWVLFRPNHYDEAHVIAQNLGEMTVVEPVIRVTRAMRGGSRSMGTQSHSRLLMTEDELRYDLTEDQVILCVGGHRPMLVSRGPLGRVA